MMLLLAACGKAQPSADASAPSTEATTDSTDTVGTEEAAQDPAAGATEDTQPSTDAPTDNTEPTSDTTKPAESTQPSEKPATPPAEVSIKLNMNSATMVAKMLSVLSM